MREDPRLLPSLPSSSPAKYETCREEPNFGSSPAEAIDFSEASTRLDRRLQSWALSRKPIEADRAGEFLDGYCAGTAEVESLPRSDHRMAGPMKSVSRRPSPCMLQSRSSSRMQRTDQAEPTPARSPFENNVHSMDTLKEAVFAPQNEDAVLTPAGGWSRTSNERQFQTREHGAKQPGNLPLLLSLFVHTRGDGLAGFPFPHRTASMVRRQGVMSRG